ncbi:hypothetical protein PoB_005356600 [Plakobranchus ocellatus]|uniref:Uncharacterized protein n=1 Tax=Plakobranchus ocellatus TaxID=259542 RepID=A0AAV4C6V3_9GAST|nr:hypothetical protein PoB_005356600 [Plakobranchus ocellatus]
MHIAEAKRNKNNNDIQRRPPPDIGFEQDQQQLQHNSRSDDGSSIRTGIMDLRSGRTLQTPSAESNKNTNRNPYVRPCPLPCPNTCPSVPVCCPKPVVNVRCHRGGWLDDLRRLGIINFVGDILCLLTFGLIMLAIAAYWFCSEKCGGGPPSGQGAGVGARTRDRRVPADLTADLLATVPPTPLSCRFCLRISFPQKLMGLMTNLA